jgi:hypothetical protein
MNGMEGEPNNNIWFSRSLHTKLNAHTAIESVGVVGFAPNRHFRLSGRHFGVRFKT